MTSHSSTTGTEKDLTFSLDFRKQSFSLMAELPAHIVTSGHKPGSGIEDCLTRLGTLLRASRIYVLFNEKEQRHLHTTHEWVNSVNGPLIFAWPRYDYDTDTPSLKNLLEAEDVIACNIEHLPDGLYQALRKQGVKTVALARMMREGQFVGLLGVDFCEAVRELSEEALLLIRHIAGLVNLAIEHRELRILRSNFKRIKEIVADEITVPELKGVREQPDVPMTLSEVECRVITETLELYNGNKLKCARHLGLTWPSLDRRCKKFGITTKKG